MANCSSIRRADLENLALPDACREQRFYKHIFGLISLVQHGKAFSPR